MSEKNTARDIIICVGGLIALRMICGTFLTSAATNAQAQAYAAAAQSEADQTASNSSMGVTIANDTSGLLASIIAAGSASQGSYAQ